METQFSHLNALEHRLHNERTRLAAATAQGERDLRTVWVAQVEREIADERARLGLQAVVDTDLSDEELIAELAAELAEPSREEMARRLAAVTARVDANAPWRHP